MRQKNAADVLGVTLKTYQNWEQGVCEPDAFKLKAVRQLIATPVNE